MAISKVVYGGRTLIDLTTDNVTKYSLLKGATAHGQDGELIEGACEYDTKTTLEDNSNDQAVTEAEMLEGKTAFVNTKRLTGTMKNRGAVSGTISTRDGEYLVPQGYHDGSGKVRIDEAERAKLVPQNIREGVSVLGVVGTMSGSEAEKRQSKEVTPTVAGFSVLPDDNYTCLTEVTVKPIPYVESANSAGGITVSIA